VPLLFISLLLYSKFLFVVAYFSSNGNLRLVSKYLYQIYLKFEIGFCQNKPTMDEVFAAVRQLNRKVVATIDEYFDCQNVLAGQQHSAGETSNPSMFKMEANDHEDDFEESQPLLGL
jgi:hypothetical protein